MDVFQVLTLCSFLGVMFLGVLGYGWFLSWQKRRLELAAATPGMSDNIQARSATDPEERIYPNVKAKTNRSASKLGSSSSQESLKQQNASEIEGEHAGTTTKGVKIKSTPIVGQFRKNSVDTSHTAVGSPAQEEPKSSKSIQTELDLGIKTTESELTKSPKKTKAKVERKLPKRKNRRSKKESSVKSPPTSEQQKSKAPETESDFVVLFVIGEHDMAYRVSDISRFFLARECVLDERGLFSRIDKEHGRVHYKVADVLYPGTFDVDHIEHCRTDGISLVMKLPQVHNPRIVFEQMLAAANEFAERYSGEVKDENFNNLSNQSIAHYRHRVSDYHRKQMSMYA